MRKSAKNFMAFALAASMVASTFAPATAVQAAKKSNVITKATYNSGDTVKYSYNGKGLVTKSVSTNSYKSSDSDTSITVTTTYKYNKKNKISSKTEKTVEKNTYYETDKTTGLDIKGKQGTLTETTVAETSYKYNKKGLATESITTTSTTMSGKLETTNKSNSFIKDDNEDGNANVEVKDENGNSSVIAGYNRHNADGSENNENTKDNAYYYTGSLDIGSKSSKIVTEYTDNGDGTYKKTYSSNSDSSGVKKEESASYYGYEWKDNVRSIIPLKRVEEKDSDGDVNYRFKKDDNTVFYGETFSVIQSIAVSPDENAKSTSEVKNEEIITDKSVTTTKYSYDKKKRVKKAIATTVKTDNEVGSYSSSSESKSTNYYSKSSDSSKNETLSETTSVETTTYTYDKKGHVKKTVVSNDGLINKKETVSELPIESSHETTYYNSKGKVSSSDKNSSSYTLGNGINFKTVTTTVVENGNETSTVTNYPYTRKYENAYIYGENRGNENSGTEVVTFYTNGGKKTEDTYTRVNRNEGSEYNYDSTAEEGTIKKYTYTSTTTGVETTYSFDEFNKSSGTVSNGTKTKTVYTYEDNTTKEVNSENESSASYLKQGDKEKTGVDATVAIDSAKGSLVEGNFDKVETDTLLAAPSKTTTTYAYDKKGNVKSAKASGTYTEITTALNEDYGNKIYEFKDNKKLKEKKVAVTHKYTNKDAAENTVKKDAKILTKRLTVSKNTYDRSSGSSSDLSRILYTIKGKKASADKVSKKQQWIIQNGPLNGEVGLD